MAVLDRVKTRLKFDEVLPDDAFLSELCQTVTDRIYLRVGLIPAGTDPPAALASIAVDASIKLYRRQYHEGINSEGAEGLSTSFVDDILSEYELEFEAYRKSEAGKVKFI